MSSFNSSVIYDFDGTLVDSTDLIAEIYFSLRDEFNFKHLESQQVVKAYRDKTKKELMSDFGLSSSELEKFTTRAQQEMGKYIHCLDWCQGVKPVLKQIKKMNLSQGILTSNSQKNVHSFLKHKSCHIFDFIYLEKGLFGKNKVLSSLLRKHDFDLQNVLYVGDEVRDIKACRQVGVKVIAVSWGFDSCQLLQAAQPDFLISDPKEIIDIVQSELLTAGN